MLPVRLYQLIILVQGMVIACMWPASQASAYEDQVTLGVEAGFAERFAESGPDHGVTTSLLASIGLDDIWTIRTRVSYSHHPYQSSYHVLLAGVEILYLIDVLEFVPYFGGGLDGLGSVWNDEFKMQAAVHTDLGIDYFFSREVIFGLEIRPYLLFTGLSEEPAYITITASANYVFEL